MKPRYFTKQELALLYFPDAVPHTASAHLMRWITQCKPLLMQLMQSGYTKSTKTFNPLQVTYIFNYLGEP